MAEVASAYVSLIPSLRGGGRAIISETDKTARTAGKRFGGIFSGSLKSIIGGALAGAGVSRLLSDSLGEAREAQKVGALTNQVIKSTGGVANVTAKHVGDLATAISNKVGVDDEAIQSGENLLLTFKNVRNEAGKGNDIFDQATHSLVDLAAGMAAASGGELDFRSSTTLVGKALNDPIKGLTALSRVGVTFTKGQQDQIKALVESGDSMKAQKIILRELKSEFGGAAKAQATDADKAQVAIKNLEEQIGTALLPVVDDLAQKVSEDVVPAISDFITEMQDGTGTGGQVVDVLSDMVDVGKGVFKFFDSLPGPVKKFGAEGLIALAVFTKFKGFLPTFATTAETSMTRTQVAAARLRVGIANLAGSAGMVALIDGQRRMSKSTDQSARSLGYLETVAGGAGIGFAFGGPMGAGVGALAGSFIGLGRALADTDEHLKDTGPDWKKYADTLDGVGAATSKATRAMVLERLEKSGLLKQTQALNISDRDAVQATLGNEAARKRLSAALKDAADKGHAYQALQLARSMGLEAASIRESRIAQLKKNLALAATKEEAQKIQAKLDKLARTSANPTISIGGYDKATKQLNAVLQLMHDIASSKGGVHGKTGGIDVLLGAGSNAGGTQNWRGGWSWVGERGPELLNIPRGSQVVPNRRSMQLASQGSSSPSGRTVLTITNWQDGTGYMEQIADSRVDSAQAFDGMAERAFG